MKSLFSVFLTCGVSACVIAAPGCQNSTTDDPVATSTPAKAEAKAARTPDEVGEISYYADSLAGNKTANGEIYQPTALTCAHRKLPFGTVLEIRELKNGTVATCRVNDRGPYAKGRILDVSRAVATKLGFLEDGHVDAELRRVPPAKNTTSAEQPVSAPRQ